MTHLLLQQHFRSWNISSDDDRHVHILILWSHSSYFHRQWRGFYLHTGGAASELWWGAKSEWCPCCVQLRNLLKAPQSSRAVKFLTAALKYLKHLLHARQEKSLKFDRVRSMRCHPGAALSWSLAQSVELCSFQTEGGHSDWLGAQCCGAVSEQMWTARDEGEEGDAQGRLGLQGDIATAWMSLITASPPVGDLCHSLKLAASLPSSQGGSLLFLFSTTRGTALLETSDVKHWSTHTHLVILSCSSTTTFHLLPESGTSLTWLELQMIL